MSQTSGKDPAGLPTIVIVGRPNVGKSTIFNAILGQRKAITGDEPGITRDRIYGEAVHRHRRFVLIDTGGIIPDDLATIPAEILKQARVALDAADQIILVVDGRTEMTSADRDLAQILRKLSKPVIVTVNKIDDPKRESLVTEFYALGFPRVMPVSAEHRKGLNDLLDELTKDFPINESEEDEEAEKGIRPIRVSIIGRPNVGKSTLLNALIGGERAIVSPVAGTTRDSVDESIVVEGREYVFIDTAGIRRKGKTFEMAEKLSVMMARKNIRMAHVTLLVLDATEGARCERRNHRRVRSRRRPRADYLREQVGSAGVEEAERIRAEHPRPVQIPGLCPGCFPLSQGKSRSPRAVQANFDSLSNFDKRIPTGELNRFAETLDFGYKRRIYYITQPSVRPPTFVLFMDTYQELHFSVERMVANKIRERFGFEGSPVIIKTRGRRKSTKE